MIEVFMDFNETDDPVISVKGVKGRSCKELTAALESKLGTVVDSQTTPEYNEREVAKTNARVFDKRK
jgi:hypothetical protein